VVEEPVALSQIAMGWVTPPAYTHDDEVLEVTMALLAGGKATRLYRSLVVIQKLASDVSASLDSNALGSSALVSAVGASGKGEDEIERALREVLETLAKNGPNAAELARAKRRVLRNALYDVQLLNGPGGENGRAGLLQRINQYLGDPARVSEWLAAIEGVTADDVRGAVSRHLQPARAVVVVTRPSAKAETNGATP
jgi:zinc protease